jgi:2-polyprenyl-6-methoxyphenol hydroxylase-like FAD-dependent oxidoreductase
MNGQRALVIGGSVAGMTAALQLADLFDEVVVVDRRVLPAPGVVGSVAPHGRMPHVLLGAGAEALERIAPGFLADVASYGGVPATDQTRGRWWVAGSHRIAGPNGVDSIFASRALLETVLRERVQARPNVTFRDAMPVQGLRAERGRVTGVLSSEGDVDADLVVDASGRHSRAPAWLRALGHREPRVSTVWMRLAYTGITVRRSPDDLGGVDFAVVQNSADLARMGVALRGEGDTWQVALGGYFHDTPGTSRVEVLRFARSLPDTCLADLLEAEWLGEPVPWGFPASVRHHYEGLRDLPPGFVVIGDAVASFNPIYGQGMSSAVLQAEALKRAVARHGHGRDLTRRVARACARIVDNPWRVATGGDFMYACTVGRKPAGTDVVNRYLEQVFRACAVDPEVNRALYRVQHLYAPPASLMRPAMVTRVLRANRRRVPVGARSREAALGT